MNNPIHTFIHNDELYMVFLDEDYQTEGSYAYDTLEETEAAENKELAMLRSGEWIVIGIKRFTKCEGHGNEAVRHCHSCKGWDEKDACWGIVVENDQKAWEKFAKEGM